MSLMKYTRKAHKIQFDFSRNQQIGLPSYRPSWLANPAEEDLLDLPSRDGI